MGPKFIATQWWEFVWSGSKWRHALTKPLKTWFPPWLGYTAIPCYTIRHPRVTQFARFKIVRAWACLKKVGYPDFPHGVPMQFFRICEHDVPHFYGMQWYARFSNTSICVAVCWVASRASPQVVKSSVVAALNGPLASEASSKLGRLGRLGIRSIRMNASMTWFRLGQLAGFTMVLCPSTI